MKKHNRIYHENNTMKGIIHEDYSMEEQIR